MAQGMSFERHDHSSTPSKLPGFSVSAAASPPNRATGGMEALLTSAEAARVLKIHPKVVERMAKRGEIPALKVGKFWRYRASALDAWIETKLKSGCQPCRIETQF
jgi:excisionase family DNA binding protein